MLFEFLITIIFHKSTTVASCFSARNPSKRAKHRARMSDHSQLTTRISRYLIRVRNYVVETEYITLPTFTYYHKQQVVHKLYCLVSISVSRNQTAYLSMHPQ